MTKKKADAAEQQEQGATPAAQQPAIGGSYVREGDGSLRRVEFTAHEPEGEAAPVAPGTETGATDQATTGQEG